eukprot:GHVQ01011747.1.p1 GENE.GHVQ01011747.1~~GHVQ01011747.1.p1  ORF type:complete len:160 (+),score=40.16 GHVQ01011747.1:352-831(+)
MAPAMPKPLCPTAPPSLHPPHLHHPSTPYPSLHTPPCSSSSSCPSTPLKLFCTTPVSMPVCGGTSCLENHKLWMKKEVVYISHIQALLSKYNSLRKDYNKMMRVNKQYDNTNTNNNTYSNNTSDSNHHNHNHHHNSQSTAAAAAGGGGGVVSDRVSSPP